MKDLLKSKVMISFIIFVMGVSYIGTIETSALDKDISRENEIVINY